MSDVTAWLILLHTPGLSSAGIQRLLATCGDAAGIVNSSAATLQGLGLKQNSIDSLLNADDSAIQADLDWLQQADNHHLIPFLHPAYPAQLKTIDSAPPLLFVRGDPDYLQQPQLAMVGSRSPTAAGRQTAFDFAQHLSKAGITITSGLARGIDGACHEGALQGIAGSVALVAHGLDIVYPAAHRGLADAISRHGAVVSEMPIGTAPLKTLFPQRNRLISGLALGTLVVEAALNSGSLITARFALEQGREVFAMPGSIHNPLARGCHRLIREGAKLVETAEDILEELHPHLPPGGAQPVVPQQDAAIKPCKEELDPDHQKLLKCLQYEPVAIDELVNRSGFSAAEVASMLLIMELEGSVVNKGGLYTRIK